MSVLACGLLILGSGLVLPQRGALTRAARAELAAAPVERRVTLLEGLVLTRDGAPAAGAVVTSSARGRAVSGADGRFSLEIELPPDAERVQLTAVHGPRSARSLASATVVVERPGSLNPGGVLRLGGGGCEPSWMPTLGSFPGSDGPVGRLEVLDDGSGPALYVGGAFTRIGDFSASCIARWDGEEWSTLGSGTDGWVVCAVEFDDGSGPALYFGGGFTTAGGVAANHIARWDGTSWSALGSGVNDLVEALAVYDDGSGPALYAGGWFTTAGGGAASRIAKWNGTSWSPLGQGVNDFYGGVHALLVFDSGSGPALHVGGFFSSAGGHSAQNIARWNGASWSAVGSGLSARVYALAAFDEGSGPRLFAAGEQVLDDSLIARWNGSAWSHVGSGIPADLGYSVEGLRVLDDGNGPQLLACGSLPDADGVTRWNGTSWSDFGPDSWRGSRLVYDVAHFDDQGTPTFFVGGYLDPDLYVSSMFEKWTPSARVPFGNGFVGAVQAFAVHDDGSGPALHIASRSTFAGGVVIQGGSKWDGSVSSPLGTGFEGGTPRALAVYDDGAGGGEALYAGGDFKAAGGVSSPRLARWDGSTWSAVPGAPSGASNSVGALAVFDGALIVGGQFMSPGSAIARWNGTSWSTLGNGLSVVGPGGPAVVRAMIVHDDGGGPALYVGGTFNRAGGNVAKGIARWNGTSWSSVGGGVPGTGPVYALAIWDDKSGGGPALYAGGTFTSIGGVTANRVARWDGAAWSPLGSGVSGEVYAMTTFDDGTGGGPALYVGGLLPSAGGIAVDNIAKWDGTSWSALGSGVDDPVYALASFDDGSGAGPILHVGGEFAEALDSGDSFFARWSGADVLPPVLSCPTLVGKVDRLGSPPGEVVFFTVTAEDECDPSPDMVCVPPSGSFFPAGTSIVTCTATDASGNESTCEFPVRVEPKVKKEQ